MPRTTVTILKFVGTVSLGLLTGISYAASTQSIPALLSLPSAHTAYVSFTKHKTATARHLNYLLAASVTSYSLAYFLSPPRGGRHPYLLWTSLVAGIAWGASTWIWISGGGDPTRKLGLRGAEEEGYVDAAGTSASMADSGFGLEPSDSTMGYTLNGEEVRKAMEKWRLVEGVRAGIDGLAFLMAVVGIWGDGFGARQSMGRY